MNYGSSNPLLETVLGSPKKDIFKRGTTYNNSLAPEYMKQDFNNTIATFSKKKTFEQNMKSGYNPNLDFPNSNLAPNNPILRNSGYSVINSMIMNNGNGNNNNNFNKTSASFSGIKLTGKTGNLRSAIEKLDLIPEHDEKEMDEFIKDKFNNIDLFKSSNKIISSNKDFNSENFKNKQRLTNYTSSSIDKTSLASSLAGVGLDEVNTFNSTILRTNNWGDSNVKLSQNKDNSFEKTVNHFKPNKREIEREIGKSIYNTKLPRARQFTKAVEIQAFNKAYKSTWRGNKSAANADKTLFNSTSLSFLKS